MNFKTLTSILLFFLLSLIQAYSAEIKWQTDMKVAKEHAQKDGKDIFALFTGSDWCSYCIRLERQILKKDNFLNNLEKEFVLLKIDFPQRKVLPKIERERNDILSEEYSVQSFPTILLLDKDAKAFAKTGYRDLKPDDYKKHLDELSKKKLKRDVGLEFAAKLNGLDKAKALITVLDNLGDVPRLQYKNIENQIIKEDPDDTTSYQKNVISKVILKGLEKTVLKLIESRRSESAVKIVDEFISKHQPTGELKQQAMFLKLYSYEKSEANLPVVDKLMDEIIKISPGTETAESAKGIKNQINEMKRVETQTK